MSETRYGCYEGRVVELTATRVADLSSDDIAAIVWRKLYGDSSENKRYWWACSHRDGLVMFLPDVALFETRENAVEHLAMRVLRGDNETLSEVVIKAQDATGTGGELTVKAGKCAR
jgi:hypothetical protein